MNFIVAAAILLSSGLPRDSILRYAVDFAGLGFYGAMLVLLTAKNQTP